MGATGGGLWKTTDGGDHLEAGHRRPDSTTRRSAPSPSRHSNPDVVYIGTGESDIRGNISRATAPTSPPTPARRGRTSASPTRRSSPRSASIRPTPISSTSPRSAITRRRIPSAASSDRRTAARRGTRSCSATTRPARIELILDPNNPQVIYAALWEAYRNSWEMSSGGPGSGIFKSTDGGDHWTEISPQPRAAEGDARQDRPLGVGRRLRTASTRRSRRTTAASSSPTTPARRGRR